MEIRYFPDDEYVSFVRSKGIGSGAVLTAIDGFYRWVITERDGTVYIAKPESAKHE